MIRWGIAGPGIIANKFACAIKNVEGAELTAVASRSMERAEEFAEKYQIPKAFGSYEEMAKSECVDAVYISTAHPFHKQCAEIFLKAGKHILCEKPVCVNTEQAIALQKCAEEHQVFLMEAMWTRFLPAIQEIKKIIDDDIIGEIKSIEADFCYATTPEEEAKLFQNHMAGGSLLDVGVYGLHFVSMFLGKDPVNITAMANVSEGVDLHTMVLLQYRSGAIAKVSSAIDLYKPEKAYIFGSKGYIYVPQFYGVQEFTVYVGDKEEHICVPSIGDGFEEEIYEVCNDIKAGKLESDVLPMDDSICILKQMDLIRQQIGVIYEGE